MLDLERSISFPWLGTRRWAAQILGNWKAEEVEVRIMPKHQLPLEVLASVPEAWERAMRKVGSQIGNEGLDWRIVPAEPYAKMEVRDGDSWKLRMFAGPQTRIEKYLILNGKLVLAHSPANYAESLATNNQHSPWELIRKYGGRTALADGHAVSVAITAIDDKGREVMQFFRRGPGLGEYGGRLGTAAGNSQRPDLGPFEIAYKESAEESRVMAFLPAYMAAFNESRILPFLRGGQEEYRRLGLATSEFEIIEKVPGGAKVRFLNRRGMEDYATLVDSETQFRMIGLALNVDAEDITPHHKSEYLFLARTKLPVEVINSEVFGWVRNDEHADALYVPFAQDELAKFALDNFLELMPPTHALALAAMRASFGQQPFAKALRATNQRYPRQDEHPLRQVMGTLYEIHLIVQPVRA